ncbi:MAG: hypothetical protein ISEC1_P0782 [Thiomicrorhabdus sp.]|nr:MAG: hypothetical protein ISEC1_P0782 [Thiomicrorhabdus sp.]
MILASLYLVLVAIFSWYRPMWAIALAANAFLINAMGASGGGAAFVMIGLGGPLICFFVIFFRGMIIEKNFRLIIGADGVLVILLFLLIMFSSLYADDTFAAFEVAIRFLFLCLLFFFTVRYVSTSYVDIDHAIISYALATMYIGFVIAVYALTAGSSSSQYVMRLTIGEGTSPIPLSLLLGQSLLIALYMMLNSNKRVIAIYAVIVGVMAYALLLTNTRSTLIGLALGVITFLILSRSSMDSRKKLILISAIVLSIPLVITLMSGSEEIYERAFSGFIRLFSGDFGTSESDRLEAWWYGVLAFSENMLLGIGAGNFGQYYIAYPHNIFIELMAENGLIGLIIIIAIVFIGLKGLSKELSEIGMLAGALFVFSLFVAQVSLTLWMHKALFIWLALVVISSLAGKKANENE